MRLDALPSAMLNLVLSCLRAADMGRAAISCKAFAAVLQTAITDAANQLELKLPRWDMTRTLLLHYVQMVARSRFVANLPRDTVKRHWRHWRHLVVVEENRWPTPLHEELMYVDNEEDSRNGTVLPWPRTLPLPEEKSTRGRAHLLFSLLRRPGYYESIAFDQGSSGFFHAPSCCLRLSRLDDDGKGTLTPASLRNEDDMPDAEISVEIFRRRQRYNLPSGERMIDLSWDCRINYWGLDGNSPEVRAANRAAAAAAKTTLDAAGELAKSVRPDFGTSYIPANIPDYQERIDAYLSSDEYREMERCTKLHRQAELLTPEGHYDEWRPLQGCKEWHLGMADPGQLLLVLCTNGHGASRYRQLTTEDGDLMISMWDTHGDGGAWLLRHREPPRYDTRLRARTSGIPRQV